MTYDTLIVGFGPVGATMANLLARRGLRIAVVEAEFEIYDKPRALTFDHEVMRIFQACGLADRIASFTAPHRGTHYLGVDGRVIKKFDPLPPPYPLAWPPTSTFVQPQLETLLRDGVAGSAAADVFLGHSAVAFTQDDEGVALTVRDVTQERERVLHGRTLLGCDGANSFVRRQLEIPLEDLGFDEWWMVVDTWIRRPVELPPRSIQYCWPSRPATFVPGPGNLRRWEIKLLPGERPEEFGRQENVVRQISRFVDPSCVEIWRSAVYRFHALLAQRWRHGRVFLLGDSCHQTPPFLGQGMCAGIRDAGNLAWKLAMVLGEGAPDALLDSYEQERQPHVRTLVATAKEFGQIIGELDPEAARVRDETLRGQLERGEVETIRQRFVPNLATGIIDREPGARAAGTLFVQPKIRRYARRDALAGEVLLDDLLRFRFLIAAATAEPHTWMTPESRELWRRLGGERIVIGAPDQMHQPDGLPGNDVQCLAETDTLFAEWMSQQRCAAVVVRPDRYVFGTATDSVQLNRLIAAVGRQVLGL
ncbi:MAG TPA: bifunctional 3-(3-hydroxy-phenyl)propionate/3-hydroxycinnamic acid hydroxylase [Burkholderiales bacterium]|nr:bifunctional 3-(3-hydroxy-phenyl)propionate/3-hydroxycinnamic acid hydroxylase [Burkholderiales bacterium]